MQNSTVGIAMDRAITEKNTWKSNKIYRHGFYKLQYYHAMK